MIKTTLKLLTFYIGGYVFGIVAFITILGIIGA
jgi:hypothetical protein